MNQPENPAPAVGRAAVCSSLVFRVVAPQFVAGGELDMATKRVTRIAPILKSVINVGMTARVVKELCDERGWDILRVP
jgi:hypothetical protein